MHLIALDMSKEIEKKKIGRPKAIESPEVLYNIFKDYREQTKSNPFMIKDWVGKDAYVVYREKEKPLTMEGFSVYCFENQIINYLGDYFCNKDNRYSEFTDVCRAIKEIIKRDQIEGGMANIYNPSITQRLNGLTEKKEIKAEVQQEIKSNIDYSKLSTETLNDLLKHSQNKNE